MAFGPRQHPARKDSMATDNPQTLKQVETQIQFLKNSLDMLRHKMAPLEQQYQELSDMLEQLLEERDALKVAQLQAGVTDWSWLLEYMPETAAREAGCRQALGRYGLGIAHFDAKTNQAVPQIRLVQGDPMSLSRHLAGLEVLLPYLTPSEDGCIVLPILGNENVGRGTWELKINPREKSYQVTAHPLYRQRDHFFTTLEDALSYIQEHLYWCTADERDA
jgi:hypothetical protein